MGPLRGIKSPRGEDDTRNNTEGYTVNIPSPKGEEITDWERERVKREGEPIEQGSRVWVCGNDTWGIWRYHRNQKGGK